MLDDVRHTPIKAKVKNSLMMVWTTMSEYEYEDILIEALERVKKGVSISLEEVIEQVKEDVRKRLGVKKRILRPLTDFIENILSLPSHLREIYFYILEKGEVTVDEIVEFFKLDKKQVERFVSQLIQSGFISYRKISDRDVYFVPRTKPLPKRRFNFIWRAFLVEPYLPPIYHYNLLCDHYRVESLKRAILSNVQEGDIVADLGAGTGILSLFAAKKAKKVYAVEINPFILEASKKIISRYPEAKKIEFIEADARTLDLEEDVDVVICEMIDTALISEHQVPVMNNAVEKFLKPNGKVIPIKAETYIELVFADYEFFGFKIPLPFYEEYGARKVVDVLTDRIQLHSIRFDEVNPTLVDKEIEFRIAKDGRVNAFRLITYVYADENILMKPSTWFNPPLVFPITLSDEDLAVRKGDTLTLNICYEMGGGLDGIEYSISL